MKKEHLDNENFDTPSQQANVGKVKNRMAMKMQGGNVPCKHRKGGQVCNMCR